MVSAGVPNSIPREGGPFSSLARVVGWRDLVDACANDVPLDHDTMHKVWTANFQLTRNFRIRIFLVHTFAASRKRAAKLDCRVSALHTVHTGGLRVMIAVGACPLPIPTVHAHSFQGLSCRSKAGGEAGLRSDTKSVSIVHVSQ
jgi:hypothetical protein